jgi:formate dehydrogenase major subunit
VFDLDDPMGASSCVACGECVQACPTGALMPKTLIGSQRVDRSVDSVCPFCGVGCQLTYNVRTNRIVSVDGRDGPANEAGCASRAASASTTRTTRQRLTVPLIRKPGAAQGPRPPATRPALERSLPRSQLGRGAGPSPPASLKALRDTHGPKALAGFGSAKGSNEEAYLFQKLVRTGFGSNNVDHCTRLCHASSVAALLEASARARSATR